MHTTSTILEAARVFVSRSAIGILSDRALTVYQGIGRRNLNRVNDKALLQKISLRLQLFGADHADDGTSYSNCSWQRQILINLWSYVGYLEIDCPAGKVSYVSRNGLDEDYVLGSQQWIQRSTDSIYYAAYSLPESLKKIAAPIIPCPAKCLKCPDPLAYPLRSGLAPDRLSS